MSKYEQAKQKLPLKRLIEHYHDAPANGKWDAFPECPFCKKRGKAGVFEKDGVEWFKCFSSDCPSDTAYKGGAITEVGYVAKKEGLSESAPRGEASPAYKRYLELAGVWEPTAPAGENKKTEEKAAFEKLIAEAIVQVRSGSTASISQLQRLFHLGHSSASRLMGELEKRGVVGPGKGSSAREVLLPNPVLPDGVLQGDGGKVTAEQQLRPTGDGMETTTVPGVVTEAAVAEENEKIVKGVFGGNGEATNEGKRQGKAEHRVTNGNGGGRGGEGDDEEMDEWEPPGQAVLQVFYDRLKLTAEDERALMNKRGLSAEAIAALGYRSNGKSNRDVLEGLREQFEEPILEASGLFIKDDKTGKLKPNAQFYGWGFKGKNSKGEEQWDWLYPIIIPYFDEAGKVVYLRPHKGGIKGKPPRFYVARTRAGDRGERSAAASRERVVVICEGEFKAGAGWEIFGGLSPHGSEIWWCALPGVSQSKNWDVWTEVKEFLKRVGADVVVVAFDNEDKGNPKLPSYKADKKKRYETVIWARYLAELVTREGYDGRVCILPSEWRDAGGKADWDGILARFRSSQMTDEAIYKQWREWLLLAESSNKLRQAGLFDDEEQRIIRNGLARLWYEPELAHGGDKEWSWGMKLKKLANTTLKDMIGVHGLAEMYLGLKGWYYLLKPLSEKMAEKTEVMLLEARKQRHWDAVWFLEKRLKGLPHKVADFKLDLKFVLVKGGMKRDRIVNIVNAQGEKWENCALDARSFTRPSDFREWLENHANATWMDGERPLQMLQRDIHHASTDMDVHEVPYWGYHADSKLWFFGEVAQAPDGSYVYPDDDGVFWYGGLGYMVSKKDEEGEDYRQGKPMLNPALDLDEVKLELSYSKLAGSVAVIPESDEAVMDEPKGEARLRAFFQEFVQKLHETLGGYEAFMATGMTLAYAAAPEIFQEFNAFPGQWVHGEMGQGKSSVVSWLVKFWGFPLDQGLNIRVSCTTVGMLIAAQQYSNMPVWFEEFRSGEIDPIKEGVLHAAYNRDKQSKKTQDGRQRVIRSGFFVTGESTSHDAATRSRYGHYQVSASRRLANHRDWFKKHEKFFVVFVRELLRNRKEYVQTVMSTLRHWMTRGDLKTVDERSKMVHGVAYAGMLGAVSLFQSHGPEVMKDFNNFLIMHCVAAVGDVQTNVNINQFWQTLLSGYEMEAFGETKSDRRKFFKVRTERVPHPPLAGEQGSWESHKLYINYNLVIDALTMYLRKQGKEMPLKANDLRDQIAQNAYWGGVSKQRFNGPQEQGKQCWVIEVDKHPLGYQRVSNEVFEASKIKDADRQIYWSREEWVDPRKGPLFEIIADLQEKPEEGEPSLV